MILAFVFACVQSVYAAGFDCGKAQTANEILICANSTVSKLDSNLSEAYNELPKTPAQVQNQKDWLKLRDRLCTTDPSKPLTEQSTKCLESIYPVQIELLEQGGPEFETCDTCYTNLYYGIRNGHTARMAKYSVYTPIADYIERYEKTYGKGSAISIAESLLDEVDSVEKRISSICSTYADPLNFGREGTVFHAPLCQAAEWQAYVKYLETTTLKSIPTVE